MEKDRRGSELRNNIEFHQGGNLKVAYQLHILFSYDEGKGQEFSAREFSMVFKLTSIGVIGRMDGYALQVASQVTYFPFT